VADCYHPGDVRRITLLSSDDAVTLYRALSDAGVRCWIVGGWGVDALLGQQTRPHKDLDVLVLRRELPQVDQVLAERGFARTLLWPNENRWVVSDGVTYPTAFVMTDALSRELDIHVVEVGGDGEPVPLWVTSRRLEAQFLDGHGCIAGTPVACMSREGQLAMHTGYDLPASHQGDIELLQQSG
jgi:lincosamide nucleotidyltransferase A/C/D/E